jgi:hypothetical protein
MNSNEYICTAHSSVRCELRGYGSKGCNLKRNAPLCECKFLVIATPQENKEVED